MDLLDESQIAEQITLYENKIKVIKQKIRDELIIRRDLKAKIDEAKKREAVQILILERLDEYEKLVNKQIELTEKMEDGESVKQLVIIEKYENMLRTQQDFWKKYEEEYKELPLAKERQKAQLRLLKVDIQNKLVNYKIEETKRMVKMKEQIDKRREQLKIIEFAKLYVEYKKREKRCCELIEKVKHLKIKEQKLRLEVQNLEKQAAEIERSELLAKKSLIKSQQLPHVDLSRFIIHRDKTNDKFDTVSINSYVLEQEYMNNDDQLQLPLNISNKSSKANESQLIFSEKSNKKNGLSMIESDVDDDTMDIPSKSNQANNQSKSEDIQHVNECSNINDKRINSYLQAKSSSKENEICEQFTNGRNTPNKRVFGEASGFCLIDKNANYRSPCNIIRRPIPSPAKIAKCVSNEQSQQYQPSPVKNHINDLTKLPPANKPQIKSCEQINYVNVQKIGKKELSSIIDNASSVSKESTTNLNNSSVQVAQQMIPTSKQNSYSMIIQQAVDITPISRQGITNIEPSSMMSTSMHSADINVYGDNISAILGSEVTEPGGSFELARRLYGDSDLNSEDGDFEYEKILSKFCSPITTNLREKQQPLNQQQQLTLSNQSLMNLSNDVSKSDTQEQTERNFTFGQFTKKQTNITKRFF